MKCRQLSNENGHKHECGILAAFKDWPDMGDKQHLTLYIYLKTVCELGLEKYVTTTRT